MNRVVVDFEGNPEHLFGVADQVEARVDKVAARLNGLNKTIVQPQSLANTASRPDALAASQLGSGTTPKQLSEQKSLIDLQTKQINQETALEKAKKATLATELQQFRNDQARVREAERLAAQGQKSSLIDLQTKQINQETALEKAKKATLATELQQFKNDQARVREAERLASQGQKSSQSAQKSYKPDFVFGKAATEGPAQSATRKAEADIARYQKQREKFENDLTSHIAKQADLRTKAELRGLQNVLKEAQRIRREEEKLSQPSAAPRRSLLGAGSISPLQLAQGTAIGAAAFAGLSLAQTAIDKAVEQARANRLLASSATEAGLAQGVLAQKNKEFAESVGLSNVAAAETTSSITRLATFSGDASPERISQLLKSFADIGAARGIAGQDLQNVVQTILSGQDEGLNRLGIADPGILQKEYAKSIHKSVDALTQQEKVTAAVNAVLEKSGTFAGAAEARMNSLEGQVAKTSAAWENFTNALSQNFVTSGPVTDFITEASNALQGLKIDLENVNRELAKGKTPRQVAEEAYPEPTAGDIITSVGTGVFYAIGGTLVADALSGNNPTKEGSLTQEVRRATLPSDIRERRLPQLVDKIAATDQSNKQQEKASQAEKDAKFLAKVDADFAALDEARRKKRLEFLKTNVTKETEIISNSFKVKEALLNNYVARTEAGEIESIRKTTELKNQLLRDQIAADTRNYTGLIANSDKPEDKAKYQQELDASVSSKRSEITANEINSQSQLITKIREAKKELGSLFTELNSGGDNPYDRIFSDGAAAIERVREATRGLSKDQKEYFQGLASHQRDLQLFNQRIDDRQAAFDLSDRARQFRQGFLDENDPSIAKEARYRATGPFGRFNGTPEQLEAAYQRRLQEVQQERSQKKFDEQLRSINDTKVPAGLTTADSQRIKDERVAQLSQGVDPARLRSDQRNKIAEALDNESKRRIKAEGDAVNRDNTKISLLERAVKALEKQAGVKAPVEQPTPTPEPARNQERFVPIVAEIRGRPPLVSSRPEINLPSIDRAINPLARTRTPEPGVDGPPLINARPEINLPSLDGSSRQRIDAERQAIDAATKQTPLAPVIAPVSPAEAKIAEEVLKQIKELFVNGVKVDLQGQAVTNVDIVAPPGTKATTRSTSPGQRRTTASTMGP